MNTDQNSLVMDQMQSISYEKDSETEREKNVDRKIITVNMLWAIRHFILWCNPSSLREPHHLVEIVALAITFAGVHNS